MLMMKFSFGKERKELGFWGGIFRFYEKMSGFSPPLEQGPSHVFDSDDLCPSLDSFPQLALSCHKYEKVKFPFVFLGVQHWSWLLLLLWSLVGLLFGDRASRRKFLTCFQKFPSALSPHFCFFCVTSLRCSDVTLTSV